MKQTKFYQGEIKIDLNDLTYNTLLGVNMDDYGLVYIDYIMNSKLTGPRTLDGCINQVDNSISSGKLERSICGDYPELKHVDNEYYCRFINIYHPECQKPDLISENGKYGDCKVTTKTIEEYIAGRYFCKSHGADLIVYTSRDDKCYIVKQDGSKYQQLPITFNIQTHLFDAQITKAYGAYINLDK